VSEKIIADSPALEHNLLYLY